MHPAAFFETHYLPRTLQSFLRRKEKAGRQVLPKRKVTRLPTPIRKYICLEKLLGHHSL